MSERRAVVGWEGVYEVSEDGRIFRIVGGSNTFVGRELKSNLTNGGYFQIMLSFQNYKKKYSVHRLVAEAFLENPENLPMVNHKDSNRQNNHYSNLEWCTQQQNIQHAVENKRYYTEKNLESNRCTAAKMRKAIIGTHLVNGEQIEFNSTAEAGRNGFNSGHISRCCKGKLPQHKGYEWRYKSVWLRR